MRSGTFKKWFKNLSSSNMDQPNDGIDHHDTDNDDYSDLGATINLNDPNVMLTRQSSNDQVHTNQKIKFNPLDGYVSQTMKYRFIQDNAPDALRWAYLRALKNYKKKMATPK